MVPENPGAQGWGSWGVTTFNSDDENEVTIIPSTRIDRKIPKEWIK